MPRVFLSYARDDLTAAERLFDRLSYLPGLEIWFDREAVYVGDAFAEIVRREIHHADYLVALMSRSYSPERFQHYELEQALLEQRTRREQGRSDPFILPVMIDEVDVALDGFNAIHRIDGSDIDLAARALRSRIKHVFDPRDAAERRVLCRAHIAQFRGWPHDAYFLKIANVASAPFAITHAWIEVADEEWYFDYPSCRPLPGPIMEPGSEWETFLFCGLLPDPGPHRYFENFRVRLSNGNVYKSYKNNNVASFGKIAGGPLDPTEPPRLVRLGF